MMHFEFHKELNTFIKTSDIEELVANKRNELHGFIIGQKIYWNLKDMSYGQQGVVVRGSDLFEEPCVLIRFKGVQYHTLTANITSIDPKTRKPHATAVVDEPTHVNRVVEVEEHTM